MGANDALILRYVHAELTPSEAEEFERRYLADDALFEELEELEQACIERYVRGELSPSEHARFERGLRATPGRRERVRLAAALWKAAQASQPVGARLAGQPVWARRLRWAAAVAAVAVVALVLPRRPPRAGTADPESAAPVRPDPTPVAWTLVPGAVRGAPAETRPWPGAGIPIDVDAYLDSAPGRPTGRVRLELVDGTQVWEQAGVPILSDAEGTHARFRIPPHVLDPRRQYILRLLEEHAREELASYSVTTR